MQASVRLTGRESQVLRLIARGCTYTQVADQLGMAAHTVASHIKNAYRKLDVHCAAAAVMRSVELGLFEATSDADRLPALPFRSSAQWS
jgi:DNA-binding CsgD family transcriptional regulator